MATRTFPLLVEEVVCIYLFLVTVFVVFFFEPLYTVNVNVSLSRQKPHSCIWMIGSNYLSKLTVCAL